MVTLLSASAYLIFIFNTSSIKPKKMETSGYDNYDEDW